MPTIADIPGAAQLQAQLDTLNRAIAMLAAEGTTISSVTIVPAPPSDPMTGFATMPVGVTMSPPISAPETLAALVSALQAQADGITQELLDMGYTQETAEPRATEPPDKPEWWPGDVPWPPVIPPALPYGQPILPRY